MFSSMCNVDPACATLISCNFTQHQTAHARFAKYCSGLYFIHTDLALCHCKRDNGQSSRKYKPLLVAVQSAGRWHSTLAQQLKDSILEAKAEYTKAGRFTQMKNQPTVVKTLMYTPGSLAAHGAKTKDDR